MRGAYRLFAGWFGSGEIGSSSLTACELVYFKERRRSAVIRSHAKVKGAKTEASQVRHGNTLGSPPDGNPKNVGDFDFLAKQRHTHMQNSTTLRACASLSLCRPLCKLQLLPTNGLKSWGWATRSTLESRSAAPLWASSKEVSVFWLNRTSLGYTLFPLRVLGHVRYHHRLQKLQVPIEDIVENFMATLLT